ncbi:MAG: outer membrane protein assembly factor BamD [Desulfobulbaceae bacterium]
MGRKRSGSWQHLYFCAAGLILVMLAACAQIDTRLAAPEIDHLRRGQHLLDQGDFAGALRENQEVFARFPHSPPGDAALFNMGLIHVHYANPKRDIGQALLAFARVEKEFPESPRAKEARIWANTLETLETARRKNSASEEEKRELAAEQGGVRPGRWQQLLALGDFEGALRENREVLARFPQSPPGDAALFNMGLIHVHYANPKRDIGQAQVFFARLAKEFPESPRTEEARIWVGILETMEKTRQIDIEIEEKKRELRR